MVCVEFQPIFWTKGVRDGTRMWRQGANLEGDIDNFIETEQLLEFEGYMSSFLQARAFGFRNSP
ncbi:hypothetical protein ACS0TY_030208 [Phlomoides rotata]